MCGELSPNHKRLPAELQEKVYRPAPGESYNIDVDLDTRGIGEEEVIT